MNLRSFNVLGVSYTFYNLTSKGRIDAVESVGTQVVVVDRNYEDIPKWLLLGYTSLPIEAQQLAAQGLSQPTHALVHAAGRRDDRFLLVSVWK